MPLLDTTISRGKERGHCGRLRDTRALQTVPTRSAVMRSESGKLHLEYRTSLRGEGLCL